MVFDRVKGTLAYLKMAAMRPVNAFTGSAPRLILNTSYAVEHRNQSRMSQMHGDPSGTYRRRLNP